MNLCFNKNYDLLVDRDVVNQTVNFYSTDSKSKFKFNSIRMSSDWKYHNEKIEYKVLARKYRPQNFA